MGNIYITEIKKAVGNTWFLIALVIGIMLAVASFLGNETQDFEQNQMQLQMIDRSYMELAPLSCYKYWIVTDYLQPATDLYYLLLPLLAVIPYSWSFALELKNGSIKNSTVRTSRSKYFRSKYLAVFISGGLIILLPILLNFILCACAMPAYMTDINAVIYVGIYGENLWSEFYYTNPLLYCIIFMGLDFTFGALWACLVLSLSFYLRNRIALMILPYIFLVFLKFSEERLFVMGNHVGLTPFTYLRGTGVQFYSNKYVVFGELALMAIIAFVITLVNYRRDIT